MRNRFRPKYRQARKEFKHDLYLAMKENKSLPIVVIKTYSSWKHRRHIGKIWSMFRNPEYMNFQKDYQANLMGSYLCGEDEIFHSLYFCERELYDKYHGRVPSRAALGDALSVAYAVLREERRNKAS